MSSIVGVFGTSGSLPDDVTMQGMLTPTSPAARTQIWRDESAVLAVAREPWQLGAELADGTLLAVSDGTVVAADASLYYREDLQRRLRGRAAAVGRSPAELILAAYEAWGEECLRYLEGDFAFVLWDRRRRLALAARDLTGIRPLFFAEVAGESLVVTSSIAGALSHPGCSDELDHVAVAEAASGLFAASNQTCYRAIRRLPAGWRLLRSSGAPQLGRFWSPTFTRSSTPFEEAALELRTVLQDAVMQRLAATGPTGLWLSGGYDSTAVPAAGESVSRQRAPAGELLAFSVRYPPGDPGHEDELITAAAAPWKTPVHWIDIESIPLLGDPFDGAARRDEPFAHPFEHFNRRLATATAASGARIALSGVGGDPLFAASPVFLADLFARLRWIRLVRQARLSGIPLRQYRALFEFAIQPALPRPVLHVAEQTLRGGRPLHWYLDRPVAEWIHSAFLRQHDLRSRERRHLPTRNRRPHAEHEVHWYFGYPYTANVVACVSRLATASGVELRSPLLDRRVIDFALSRPHSERISDGQTKRLLRAAMRGLLPDSFLAPRRARTGLSSGYFERSMRGAVAPLLLDSFRAPVLEQLGLVDGAILRDRCRRYIDQGASGAVEMQLFLTLQTELWLRARVGAEAPLNHGLVVATSDA
jgi:asparagine synthase (glutamine-hydrolysing)